MKVFLLLIVLLAIILFCLLLLCLEGEKNNVLVYDNSDNADLDSAMNEQLLKLCKEATGSTTPFASDMGDWKVIEKLAELIVRECADFLADTLDDHFAAEQLRDHFGVEE